MRNNLELVIILKKRLYAKRKRYNKIRGSQSDDGWVRPPFYCKGLCNHVDDLLYNDLITLSEKHSLMCILHTFKPIDAKFGSFWWQCGVFTPRYKFVCDIIKKLESCQK